MRRDSLNDDWTVRQKTNRFAERMGQGVEPEAVTLPHDALIGTERSPSGSPASAYFPGGVWEYRRTFELGLQDAADTCVLLEFEGVYRDALVFVNDKCGSPRVRAGTRASWCRSTTCSARRANDIRVEARVHEDSRWYSGAGIYRSVWLLRAGRVHLEPAGVQVTTAELDDEMAVRVGRSGRAQPFDDDVAAGRARRGARCRRRRGRGAGEAPRDDGAR